MCVSVRVRSNERKVFAKQFKLAYPTRKSKPLASRVRLTLPKYLKAANSSLPLVLLGLALIVGGLWIRYSAMRTLASFFTYAVEVQEQHRLVETGMYRIVRHPGYLGQLLVFLGIGLALANWISLLGLALPIGLAFSRRIAVEEQALRQHFAGAYEAYARRSWRLIPWLY